MTMVLRFRHKSPELCSIRVDWRFNLFLMKILARPIVKPDGIKGLRDFL